MTVDPSLYAKMIASFCPKCGGWTMYHGDADSDTGREWAAGSARHGDIVIRCQPDALGGRSCDQSELKAHMRTCDQPAELEVDDAA